MTFPHGDFSVYEDLICIRANPVNDRFSNRCVLSGSQTIQPSFCLELRAEDYGTFDASGFDDFKKVTALFTIQGCKQEFVQYEKAHFVVSAYRFLKGPLPMGNRKFPKQIRKPDISYTEIASTCRHAKGIGQICFSTAGSSF